MSSSEIAATNTQSIPPAAGAERHEQESERTREGGAGGGGAGAADLKLSPFQKVFNILLYSGVSLFAVGAASPEAREFITGKPWWPAIGVGLLLAIVLTPNTRSWFAKAAPQSRIGIMLLVAGVGILMLFVGIFHLTTEIAVALLRLLLILLFCALPAFMYYLFIATKKYSLYNEFVINLKRLGLIDPARLPPALVCESLAKETEEERKKRILTYMQKFEAVYGAVPTDLGEFALKATDTGKTLEPTGDDGASAGARGGATSAVDTSLPVILPVIIATLLISIGWLITLPPGLISLQPDGAHLDDAQALKLWKAVFIPDASADRFAFIGAYFFSLQLLFRRYVRRDLRASAYVAVSMRIALAVIGIWVVNEAVNMAPEKIEGGWAWSREALQKSLPVLGFVIGVFPRVAWQVVTTSLKRAVGLVVPSLQTQLPVNQLDGLTVWHEARLEEEDIENIPNMATADIVDLMTNTRLPPDRIIDWVDQAILYTHLGPEKVKDPTTSRAVLRAHGIRTASALVEAYNMSARHQDQEKFEAIFPGDGRNRMRSLVDAVGTNPNLKLIQTWRGVFPHTHPAPAQAGA